MSIRQICVMQDNKAGKGGGQCTEGWINIIFPHAWSIYLLLFYTYKLRGPELIICISVRHEYTGSWKKWQLRDTRFSEKQDGNLSFAKDVSFKEVLTKIIADIYPTSLYERTRFGKHVKEWTIGFDPHHTPRNRYWYSSLRCWPSAWGI